MRMQTEQT